MTSAKAVANFFIGKSQVEGRPISPMKLQKLVFYAQAWYLGNAGKELFPEDIEAWPYGPVVRDLYLEFRRFGSSPITALAVERDWLTGADETPTVTDPEIIAFLEKVWRSYGGLSAVAISNLTHLPGEPWRIMLDGRGTLDDKPRIPSDLIREVFEGRVKNIKPAVAAVN